MSKEKKSLTDAQRQARYYHTRGGREHYAKKRRVIESADDYADRVARSVEGVSDSLISDEYE